MKELSKAEIFRRLAESPEGVELAVWGAFEPYVRKVVGYLHGFVEDNESMSWNHAGLPTASMWVEASDMPEAIKKQWHELARFPDLQCEKECVFDCETFCNWSGTEQGIAYWALTHTAFEGNGEYPEPWKPEEDCEPETFSDSEIERVANEMADKYSDVLAYLAKSEIDEAIESLHIDPDLKAVLKMLNERVK